MTDRVTPMIHVPDVQATVDWYQNVGFTVNQTYGNDNGGLSFAVLSFGSTQVMFSQDGKTSPERRREVDLYTYATGVDKLFERLKDRVEVIEGVHETFYGMREFIVRDLNGFWITFAENSAYGKLMSAMYKGDLEAVKVALERGGIKPEWLTNALISATSAENKNDAIAELLRSAGATLPPEVDAETLQKYTGRYRSDMGPSAEMLVKDDQLNVVISGEGQLHLIPIDQQKFRHQFLDHVTVTFEVENGRAVGFEFCEGDERCQYVRVEDMV